MKQAFIVFVIAVNIAALFLLTFTVISVKKTNESLKQELREVKTNLSNCRKAKSISDSSFESMYNSYIDLGIRCGANE